MVDHEPEPLRMHTFAAWEPLLRLLLADRVDQHATAPVRVSGAVGRCGSSLRLRRRRPSRGRAFEDMRQELDAASQVRAALLEAGVEDVSFTAEISATGQTALHLFSSSPSALPGIGSLYPGDLLLVEGAVPEPWRRLPGHFPQTVPAPTADPALLERTLRERLPDAVGATGREIADAESRLGSALPEELKALYRVLRARREDWGGRERSEYVSAAVGCELFSLDELHIADSASRRFRWAYDALEAVVTPPDAAVQGLVGSPGWIAFGDNGGGDRLAIDLTPGPKGRAGQIILLSHEESIGADLIADSLTDLVLGRPSKHQDRRHDRRPFVAHVNRGNVRSVHAAAHPDVEVVSIGVWEDEPVSLAPLVGLPRLRTFAAFPGTLADPLEIAELSGLEFLGLGSRDWRVLLDRGAVPRTLAAASITVRGDEEPRAIVALANEILALWGRPLISETVIEGDLASGSY